MCQSGLTYILLGLAHLQEEAVFFKHEEVIANNGTNKGASETKLHAHVGKSPFFIPM